MRTSHLFLGCLFAGFTVLLSSSAQSQIIPDRTLGVEPSVVTPNVDIDRLSTELIEGGATRGNNLFHSFSDFNIPEGERVYFANPAGIESILSRVTGQSASNIFGTLGVQGTADLFFLNPNGVVFGPSVELDVPGSLYVTTAEASSTGRKLIQRNCSSAKSAIGSQTQHLLLQLFNRELK